MGGGIMIGQSLQMRTRQSAVRIFAQEYSEASLIEQGLGEFDPSFVVTKLGARVNRCLVGGVIENLERRDADSGPFYSGQIRDPSGKHYFSVPPFKPELHPEIEELLARFDSGDRFLMIIVGRARWSESEEGGVFTSINTESFSVIGLETYSAWLVETSEATLRRLDAYGKSSGSEIDESSLESEGVPKDLIQGLIQARGHYSEFDTEAYRMWVLKALSAASGKSDVAVEISAEPITEKVNPTESEIPEGSSPKDTILVTLRSSGGAQVDYDSLVGACVLAGSSREEAEDAIEHLRDVSMEISEPRFGYFSIIS